MVRLIAGDGDDSIRTCMLHRDTAIDMSCPQCAFDWTCKECNEIRYDDQRVEHGLMCFVCTYEYKGGE